MCVYASVGAAVSEFCKALPQGFEEKLDAFALGLPAAPNTCEGDPGQSMAFIATCWPFSDDRLNNSATPSALTSAGQLLGSEPDALSAD